MRSITVLACVCLFVHTPHEGQVKKVGIALRSKPAEKLQVTVENLRSSPIIELSIDLSAPGVGQRQRYYANLGGHLGRVDTFVPPNGGPVASHERRTIDVSIPVADVRWTPSVSLVAFADNYYEGTAPALNAWRDARQNEADELGYWIRAIDTIPRDSLDGARAHLESRAVDRAGQNPHGDTQLRVRMWTLATDTRTSLPDFLAAVDRARAEANRQLTILRPSLVGALRVRPITSVSVSSVPASGTAYVVAISNNGAAPIEAFGYESVDPAGRAESGVGTDMCEMPPGTGGGHGRIAPGEVREYPFNRDVEAATAPHVRMKYVLFEDLSFEGSSADRDALFRDRERRADDLAFALGALRRAIADPPQALAIMTNARDERARQLQEQGRPGGTGLWQLDKFIRSIKASPGGFAATAGMGEASLESQRQRLLRHLSVQR